MSHTKSLCFSFILFALTLISPTPTRAYGVIDAVISGIGVAAVGCPDPNSPLASNDAIHANCKPESEAIAQPELGTWIKDRGKPGANGVGSLFNTMAAMIQNRPAGVDIYLADVIQNINPTFAQQAYAQGLGFASLSPILPIWKAFRNLAYFLFVIIFVVIGFAIMFRAKLNPQTVISIENALPNLVITLLLITFSYAIAGLLIDAMYLTVYLVINLADQYFFNNHVIVGPNFPETSLRDIAFNRNIISNLMAFFGTNTVGNIATALGEMFRSVIDPDLGSIDPGSSGDWFANLIAQGIGIIFGLIAWAVIALTILFNAFKIFFTLLMSYVQIIIYIVFSPILLLLNALPGSSAFTNWLKNMTAHLAIFPVIIGLVFLTFALAGVNTQNDIGYTQGAYGGFTPPQLLVAGSGNQIQALIALGMILAIPTLADKVKEAFGVGGQGGRGGGGGGFLGGFAGGLAGGGLFKQAGSAIAGQAFEQFGRDVTRRGTSAARGLGSRLGNLPGNIRRGARGIAYSDDTQVIQDRLRNMDEPSGPKPDPSLNRSRTTGTGDKASPGSTGTGGTRSTREE